MKANSLNKHLGALLDPDQQIPGLISLKPARHWLLVCLMLMILPVIAACEKKKTPREPIHRQQLTVFGTQAEITIYDNDTKKVRNAIAIISKDFQRMHRDWHAWKPGALVQLNKQIAQGKRARVHPSLLSLIKQSKILYQHSDGLFNPAIGKVIGLWGFHRDQFPAHTPPPAKAAIAKLLAKRPGMDDVLIQGSWVKSRNPAVQFDFGAIAKGHAVDLTIKRLRQLGINNAIVNAGGDLRVIGKRGQQSWRVGVQHPQGQGILATIKVHNDEGVFTSGNYERFNEHAGVRYPHIIDPRSGWPVKGIASVTVIYNKGAVADAAATALVIAGHKDWRRIAKRMGIRHVMLVDESGAVVLSPSMSVRIRFEAPGPSHVRLSKPL